MKRKVTSSERTAAKRAQLLASGWTDAQLDYAHYVLTLHEEGAREAYHRRILAEAEKPGMSDRKMAQLVGLTHKTFWNWRKRLGLPGRLSKDEPAAPPPPPPPPIEKPQDHPELRSLV